MAVTRDEAKLYLRIDNDVEDALIDSLIQSSTTTVENVLRHPLKRLHDAAGGHQDGYPVWRGLSV
jgi:hypothetical protein